MGCKRVLDEDIREKSRIPKQRIEQSLSEKNVKHSNTSELKLSKLSKLQLLLLLRWTLESELLLQSTLMLLLERLLLLGI